MDVRVYQKGLMDLQKGFKGSPQRLKDLLKRSEGV